MSDCFERLVSALNNAGVSVFDAGGSRLIGREGNARTVVFWESAGKWRVDHMDWVDQKPVATFSTADRDMALRWLVCCVANQYRHRMGWPWLLPLRAVRGFARGWSASRVSEDSEKRGIRAMGQLIRPDGVSVEGQMRTAFPSAVELAALSHLMDLSPDQVLDSYLTPEGGALESLVESENPVAVMGEGFRRMVAAVDFRVVADEDGFHWSVPGMVLHVWIEDGCWCFGHTERGEERTMDLVSVDRDLVLRWIAYEWLNGVRRSRGWPQIMAGYWKPVMAPGWSQQQLGDRHGILIGPGGDATEVILHAYWVNALDVLSHLMNLDLEQVVDSFLAEDGGLLREVVDSGPKRSNQSVLDYVAQYGDRLDRVGDPRGSYFCAVPGPKPYSFEQRSLPPSAVKEPYYRYRLLDLPPYVTLVSGIIAPWFGQPGGARQVLFQVGEILLTAEECIDLHILEGDS